MLKIRKKLVIFKDELHGKIMTEFSCLKKCIVLNILKKLHFKRITNVKKIKL